MRQKCSDKEITWRKQFGDRLRRLIHIKGMTQKQAAYALGIDEAVLSKYITGACTPSAYKIAEIAKVLDCDINQLFDNNF